MRSGGPQAQLKPRLYRFDPALNSYWSAIRQYSGKMQQCALQQPCWCDPCHPQKCLSLTKPAKDEATVPAFFQSLSSLNDLTSSALTHCLMKMQQPRQPFSNEQNLYQPLSRPTDLTTRPTPAVWDAMYSAWLHGQHRHRVTGNIVQALGVTKSSNGRLLFHLVHPPTHQQQQLPTKPPML